MRAMFDTRTIKKRTKKEEELKEINRLRESSGLPLISNTPRPCMRCGREFISEGNWHRLCWTCSNAIERAEL
jgi:predicted Zn-ribbon and HTH transcriptional regulator